MVEYVKQLNLVFTKQSNDVEGFDYTNLKPKFGNPFGQISQKPPRRDKSHRRQ